MIQFIESFISEKGEISFVDHGGWESRSESTISLFKQAFGQISDKTKFKRKHFYIHTGDVSAVINNELTFGYTISPGVVACPDFSFEKWVECGINNYEDATKKIVDSSNNDYSVNRLFWIGNVTTQPLRRKLLELGNANRNKMEIISMGWTRLQPKGSMHRYSNYTTLEGHTRYKYLIDTGGEGFSARVKYLLHTNRPLFLVDRDENKKEYFYNSLVPFKHFIPVKENLSNLLSQLDWAENNYTEAIRIAGNARQFALEHLNKRNVIHYLANAIQWNCCK